MLNYIIGCVMFIIIYSILPVISVVGAVLVSKSEKQKRAKTDYISKWDKRLKEGGFVIWQE